MGKYLKESCCSVVKPHRLGDAEDGVVWEEGEEVEEAGEVGAGQADKILLLFQCFTILLYFCDAVLLRNFTIVNLGYDNIIEGAKREGR